ncbi:MAG TPA: dihydrolipoamide acetyltransferase family protein [Fimbriimonadaceae bacterium]|nr:dihydrolipoamide acetyltransferase family protein [Fimbriimonadaceae bacterium]
MTDVIMPKMGDGMEEGTLLEWLKKEGDSVKSGEVIGTIQTDKATLELESPGSGKLAGILIKGGDTVPVGRPIAAILKDGERLPANWGNGEASAPAEPAKAAESAPPTAESASQAANGHAVETGRVKASPLARKIAAEKGIDLSTIVGSGPGGRIVEKDVIEAEPGAAPRPAPTPSPAIVATGEDRTVPLNRLRQITGQRTLQSKTQVPHFYVTVEVDVEAILSLRAQFEAQGAGKPSVNDFVVRACALALRDLPDVNASLGDKAAILHGAVNIGMAVAIDDGLTVPVIKNADQLTLRQISTAAKDLAKKARENKLGMDELSGSTFSISNMGMLDVDEFIAIINAPNAAILAVASARKRVVANEAGEIVVRSRMNITGSFDHRLVDGAGGAKFVNLVRGYLENPMRLVS